MTEPPNPRARPIRSMLLAALVTLVIIAATIAALPARSDADAVVEAGDVVRYRWEARTADGQVVASSSKDDSAAPRAAVFPAGEADDVVELGPYVLGQRPGATVTTPLFRRPFGETTTVWIPQTAGPFPLSTPVTDDVLANASVNGSVVWLAEHTVRADIVPGEGAHTRVRLDLEEGQVIRLPRFSFDTRVHLLNDTHFEIQYLLGVGQTVRAGPCFLDLDLPQGNLTILARETNGTFRVKATPLDVPRHLVDVDLRFVLHILTIEEPEPDRRGVVTRSARAAADPVSDAPSGFGLLLDGAGCCDWCRTLAKACPLGVSTFRCGDSLNCDCFFLCAATISAAALVHTIDQGE